jgi:hypothetical protein
MGQICRSLQGTPHDHLRPLSQFSFRLPEQYGKRCLAKQNFGNTEFNTFPKEPPPPPPQVSELEKDREGISPLVRVYPLSPVAGSNVQREIHFATQVT